MNDKTFIDTNVLIYAHDVDAKRKQEAAKRTILPFGSLRIIPASLSPESV
jgi:predicted nucleic acid-binding protein